MSLSLALMNAASKLHGVSSIKGISYDQTHDLALDIYCPNLKKLNKQQPTPVMVFFYGGAWNSGARAMYEFLGRRMANEGVICIIPDYRLYPAVTYPGFLDDCALAVKKVTQLIKSEALAAYQPDQKIFLMGHSAGAYNTAMLALSPEWLKKQGLEASQLLHGWIGLAGPYDMYPIDVEDVKPVFHHPDYPPASNPIDFVANANIPSLLVAPAKDDVVSIPRHTHAMSDALKAAGKSTYLATASKTDHVLLIAAFSPLVFFTGNVLNPIKAFIGRVT